MPVYVPTSWVNGTTPAINATNLNKLKNELASQAADPRLPGGTVAHTLQNWTNGTAPAVSSPTNLNEMERVIQVVAAKFGFTYTPTAWLSGWVPARNAANLNHMELQAQQNRAAIEAVVSGTTLYGVHQDLLYVDPGSRTTKLNLLTTLHAKISRSSLPWDQIETSQNVFDWSATDGAVAGLASRGVKCLFFPINGPSWLTGSGDPVFISQNASTYNTFVSRYANFCGIAAARYPGLYWEIWNEVNEQYFWHPDGVSTAATSVTQYVQMYNAARTAILAADPTAKVAAGSVSGVWNTGGHINGAQWFVDMKNAGCTITAAGIHPYDQGPGTKAAQYWAPDLDEPGTPDQEHTDIARTKGLFDANGMSAVKLWVTEWGWNSNQFADATAATYVTKGHDMIRDQYASYVELSTYFMDWDNQYPAYGLVRGDFSLKAMGTAFQNWMIANGQ